MNPVPPALRSGPFRKNQSHRDRQDDLPDGYDQVRMRKIVAIGEGYAGGEKEGQIEFREFCAMLTMAHGKGSLYEQIERMKQQLPP